MPHFRQRTTRAVLLSGLMLAGTTPATAQTVADYQALRNKVDELQRRLDTVQRALTAKEPRETPPVNPYTLGLRRAVAGYGGFAVGQDWSNFQYVAALPETADFVGVTDGTVLVRQMLLRYSHPVGDGWTISTSIENPETVSAMAGAPALADNDDDSVPDLTGQLLWAAKGASLSLTGLFRSMRVDPANGRPAVTAQGYGVSLAGIAPLSTGKGDDIRFMMTGGRGLGRYVGANVAADAIYDTANDRLVPVPLLAGFAGVRHFWIGTLRSTWMGSFQRIWNPATASPLSTRQVWDTAVNLFVSSSCRSTTPCQTFSDALASALATLLSVRVGPSPMRIGRPVDRWTAAIMRCAAATSPNPFARTGRRKKLSSIE